jgi:WD40 repeat protein
MSLRRVKDMKSLRVFCEFNSVVRFFHSIFEDEIARCKGHFGPINTLAWSPDGKSFASGGEDGYVRVHHLEQSYFDFQYDQEVNPQELDL